MKPTLQFRQTQQLALTPQLQQSIRLLQLSTVELNQEIERVLMENPLIEREDPAGADDTDSPAHAGGARSDQMNDAGRLEQSAGMTGPESEAVSGGDTPGPDDLPHAWAEERSGGTTGSPDDEGDATGFMTPDSPTLRDHLVQQLSLLNADDRDRQLVGILIDALNEDGYLVEALEDIVALFPPEAGVGTDDLAIALRHLQNLEPVGVGARSPAECLALQLRSLRWDSVYDESIARLAMTIVEQHLALLAERNYMRLRAVTGADEDMLRDAQQLICGLNPRPGASFARVEARYVIPDVIVRKVRDGWRAFLNADAMPRLRLNRLYAGLSAGARAQAPALKSHLQEARWFIKNIRQRFETILRVAQAIVDRQRHFFEHGEIAMRPLVLKEIADVLGLHESTISRVTNQKYMTTPRGTVELKYFFGSHVATEAGGTASSTAIRAVIRQLVAAEDGHAPLSDARISRILGEQGIVVARRTVAKYRDVLHIPPVSQRKSL